MNKLLETKYFLPITFILMVVSYFVFADLPAYTRWAIILLVLPSLFFLFRKESTLNYTKVTIVSVVGIMMGLIWDHVAIKAKIWDFPPESVSGWFLGIPIEEYIFAVGFSIIIIGLYTSLPKFKEPEFVKDLYIREVPLLFIIFALQISVWVFLFHVNAQSYLYWLLFLVILPSFFYTWRRGEKIDEIRLTIVTTFIAIVTVIVDWIFIKSNSWFHYDDALIGRIGIVPFDDVLFGIFVCISVVGFYTSLPSKNWLTGKW